MVDPTSYTFEAVTPWKRLQLYAAAMSNPSKIAQYKIGHSIDLSDWQKSAQFNPTNLAADIESGMQVKAGFVTDTGQFQSINWADSTCDGCGNLIEEKINALIAEGGNIKVFNAGEIAEEPKKLTSKDIVLFWSANNDTVPSNADATLLKPSGDAVGFKN